MTTDKYFSNNQRIQERLGTVVILWYPTNSQDEHENVGISGIWIW